MNIYHLVKNQQGRDTFNFGEPTQKMERVLWIDWTKKIIHQTFPKGAYF